MSTDDINKNQLINSFSPKLKSLLDDFIIKDNVVYITLKAANKIEAEKNVSFKLECEKKLKEFNYFKNFFVSFVYSEKKFKKIIAVASCKGGVGKSTIATNLSFALRDSGNKVGLLDADIYGPSIPKMLNLKNRAGVDNNKKIIPAIHKEIEVMSIGLLVDENKPLVWRGPMQQSAISQLINEVAWSSLDFLVVDLPPGTGDAYLTVSQKLNIDHAIIVTTSEKLAIADTRKGINMLKQLNIPILGIIENMSYLKCKKCGEKNYLFGKNNAFNLAKEFDLKLLGKLPFYHNNLSNDLEANGNYEEYQRTFQEIIKRFDG